MAGADHPEAAQSLFGSIVALVPDASFALARELQRATVSVVHATTRVSVGAAIAVFSAPPMQRPLEIVETQLRPIAERGAEQRRQDAVAAQSLMTRLEPLISALLERVVDLLPIDALLARVDVDALIHRVDVDSVVRRVDVNALISSLDLSQLITDVLAGIELGDLIQDSTTNVVSDARDAVRVQAMNADNRLAAIIDRLLLRKRERDLMLPGYQPSGAM